MDGLSDSYWRMPSPSDGLSGSASNSGSGLFSSAGASGSPFDALQHARLSPSALDPNSFSSNFIMPKFAANNGSSFGFAVAEPDAPFRGAPKSTGMDYENNGLGAFSSFGYNDVPTSSGPSGASTSRAGSSASPPVSAAPRPYQADGPVYTPYGSSVVSVSGKDNSTQKSLNAPYSASFNPTNLFDPVALGVPAPPESSTNFAGLYSSSGFDIIGVLARVAARPHQAIQIGPVDLSCSFLVVDAKRYDMPIVFASETFSSLTGYSNSEIIGRNCRFLQSPDGLTSQGAPRKYTDGNAAWHMRTHITSGKESQSSLINYRRSGEAFINLVTIVPITWDSDEIAYYVGFQVDLVDQPNAILARMKDGSYTVNYSLLNNPPRSVSMQSVEASVDTRDSWAAPMAEEKPVLSITPPTIAPQALVESDDMDEEALLDIIASEGITGLGTDDERKQFNKLLLDNSNDFIHVLSLKGSILYASPSASKILEYEPSELVGTLIQGLCHPSDVVPVVRELKDSGSISHAKVNLLYRIQRKNSGYIWIEAAGKLHVEPGKGRKCVILIGRRRETFKLSWDDVRREGGLAEKEFWTKLSREGMMLTATGPVQSVTGFSPSEMVGTSIFQLVQPTAEGQIRDAMRRCLAGEGVTVEYQMKSRNGLMDVVTHFYARQVKAFDDEMMLDAELQGPPHLTIIAQTSERTSHYRKVQQRTFFNSPVYVPGPHATVDAPAPASMESPDSDIDGGQPSGPPPFASTFKTLDHPSMASDNIFDELDTTRCTSWQYELHQPEDEYWRKRKATPRKPPELPKLILAGAGIALREPIAEPIAVVSDPESARHAAFQELETFRTTVDALRSRISGLEGILATAFSSPTSFPKIQNPAQSHSDPAPTSYPLPLPFTSVAEHPYYSPQRDIAVNIQQPQASTSYLPYQDSRTTSEGRENSTDGGTSVVAEELRGEDVEASVLLEFMALGRHRNLGKSEAAPNKDQDDGEASSSHHTSPHARDVAPGGGNANATTFPPSPQAMYPTTASLALVAPGRDLATALIDHSLDWMGWHHAAVHAPSFKKEATEFWEWGENRMETCSSDWLALWFALLVVGVGNLAAGQAPVLGISEDERSHLAKTCFLLQVDERLSSIISNCPAWLYDDGPTLGMPPCVEWVRNTFRISSNHKVLTLHRPFLHRAFRDPRFESSRRRAITASRNILREAARCSDIRLWTVPYHISAAACVALLEIFQRNSMHPTDTTSSDLMLAEVLGALATLERMQKTSSIARRGVALIQNLVAEEKRLREERERTGKGKANGNGRKRKKEGEGEGSAFKKAAKKYEADMSPRVEGSPTLSSTASDSSFSSPAAALIGLHSNGNGSGTHARQTPFSFSYDPTSPHTHVPPLPSTPSSSSTLHDAARFDFATASALPQEFLSIFLEHSHEFDPLDGAIFNQRGRHSERLSARQSGHPALAHAPTHLRAPRPISASSNAVLTMARLTEMEPERPVPRRAPTPVPVTTPPAAAPAVASSTDTAEFDFLGTIRHMLTDPEEFNTIAILLLLSELFLCFIIIRFVP
ncbi:hypothetical protein P7C70_g5272, partial [Phenoliferia sp. Uapishka_3]